MTNFFHKQTIFPNASKHENNEGKLPVQLINIDRKALTQIVAKLNNVN